PPEPGRLTRTLVQGGEGVVVPQRVLGHPDRLRWAEGRHHRNDCVVLVGRIELDVALAQRAVGLRGGRRPALGDDGRPHRSLKRVARVAVVDSRSAVQQHRRTEAGYDGSGGGDVDESRLALVETPDDLGVGSIDDRSAASVQTVQDGNEAGVATSRDAPVDDGDGTALGGDGLGEQRQADVHDDSRIRKGGDAAGGWGRVHGEAVGGARSETSANWRARARTLASAVAKRSRRIWAIPTRSSTRRSISSTMASTAAGAAPPVATRVATIEAGSS